MIETAPKGRLERAIKFFENIAEIIEIIGSVPFVIGSIIRGWEEDSKSPTIKEDDIHYL